MHHLKFKTTDGRCLTDLKCKMVHYMFENNERHCETPNLKAELIEEKNEDCYRVDFTHTVLVGAGAPYEHKTHYYIHVKTKPDDCEI